MATKPQGPTKPKLTVTKAVEQWKAADDEAAKQKALLAEARAVILPHMEAKGLKLYKGIRLEISGGNRILDQEKVKAFLGARLTEFQTRSSTSKSLKRAK